MKNTIASSIDFAHTLFGFPKQRRSRFKPERFLKAFLLWLEKNQTQLLVQFKIYQQTKELIEFEIIGYPAFLQGIVDRDHVGIYINDPRRKSWYGKRAAKIGWLFDYEVPVVNEQGRYTCAFCEPPDRDWFHTPEELWENDLFAELKSFLNEKLSQSAGVHLLFDKDFQVAQLAFRDPLAKKKTRLKCGDFFDEIWDWQLGQFVSAPKSKI